MVSSPMAQQHSLFQVILSPSVPESLSQTLQIRPKIKFGAGYSNKALVSPSVDLNLMRRENSRHDNAGLLNFYLNIVEY